jgi:hypothetical protein
MVALFEVRRCNVHAQLTNERRTALTLPTWVGHLARRIPHHVTNKIWYSSCDRGAPFVDSQPLLPSVVMGVYLRMQYVFNFLDSRPQRLL